MTTGLFVSGPNFVRRETKILARSEPMITSWMP